MTYEEKARELGYYLAGVWEPGSSATDEDFDMIEAALIEAENNGLEKAAEKADTFFDWCGPIGETRNMVMAQSFGKECAQAIRALKTKER